MSTIDKLVADWRELGPVKWAEHPQGWIMEDTGRPIKLEVWQRAVLKAWWEHRDSTSTLAISNVKKTGKTTADAIVLCWRWLALPGQHFACANDLDQSQGLQFRMIAKMVERHPFLAQHVVATRTRLIFEPTGSELEALSVDAAGSAGANHLTSSHTEAWGIRYEAGRRAYEELTPQPGRFYGLPALRIVDSYAGWEGESQTWHDLLERGKGGERVSRRWPIFRADGLLLFHIEGEEAQRRCFRGPIWERLRYYRDQRADFRPATFQRIHLNRETAGESAFITPAMWAALPVRHWKDVAGWEGKALSVGVDIGVVHDYTAVCSVLEHEGIPQVGPFRVWKPPNVSFGAVEEYLLELKSQWRYLQVWADPYQAAQLMERLAGKGLSVEEFPQTVGNLTEAGNRLFEAIRQQRLVIPPGADELRDHVLGATAKETDRGIRLVKSQHSRRIDLAISLAMALVRLPPEGARQLSYCPNYFYSDDVEEFGEQGGDIQNAEAWRDFQKRGVAHSPAYYQTREAKRKRDCAAQGGPPEGCPDCWWRMRRCPDHSYEAHPGYFPEIEGQLTNYA